MEEVLSIIRSIEEVKGDLGMPKNVKEKLSEVASILNTKSDESTIMISKALDKIEEIVDDANLQPYARTQIWNIASMLESL